jgi:hypothetical protein
MVRRASVTAIQKILFLFVLFVLLFSPLDVTAASVEAGFLAMDVHRDTRDRTMLTSRQLLIMPNHVTYFGLLNLFTPLNTEENADLTDFYSEQNIQRNFSPATGLNLQIALTSGGDGVARGALAWSPSNTPGLSSFFQKIRMRYHLYFHLLQVDFEPTPGWGWQIEHVYQIDLIPDWLYLNGFADQNFQYKGYGGGDRQVWVYEHQLNLRLMEDLFAIAEIRHEAFLNPSTGYGLGVEYVFRF